MITKVVKNKKGQYIFSGPMFTSPDIAQSYPEIQQAVALGLYGEVMKIFGDCILERLRDEVTRLMGRHVLPKSKAFYDSFGYEINETLGSLTFYSTWDKASIYIPGAESYKMTWLTRQKGVTKKIPMKDKNGKLVFRSVPLTTNNAWVHPGIQKFSFFSFALEEGRWDAAPKIIDLFIKKGIL
jgi:hypothetical protein